MINKPDTTASIITKSPLLKKRALCSANKLLRFYSFFRACFHVFYYFRAIIQLQAIKNLLHMIFNGVFGEIQLIANFLVSVTISHQVKDLRLHTR